MLIVSYNAKKSALNATKMLAFLQEVKADVLVIQEPGDFMLDMLKPSSGRDLHGKRRRDQTVVGTRERHPRAVKDTVDLPEDSTWAGNYSQGTGQDRFFVAVNKANSVSVTFEREGDPTGTEFSDKREYLKVSVNKNSEEVVFCTAHAPFQSSTASRRRGLGEGDIAKVYMSALLQAQKDTCHIFLGDTNIEGNLNSTEAQGWVQAMSSSASKATTSRYDRIFLSQRAPDEITQKMVCGRIYPGGEQPGDVQPGEEGRTSDLQVNTHPHDFAKDWDHYPIYCDTLGNTHNPHNQHATPPGAMPPSADDGLVQGQAASASFQLGELQRQSNDGSGPRARRKIVRGRRRRQNAPDGSAAATSDPMDAESSVPDDDGEPKPKRAKMVEEASTSNESQ